MCRFCCFFSGTFFHWVFINAVEKSWNINVNRSNGVEMLFLLFFYFEIYSILKTLMKINGIEKMILTELFGASIDEKSSEKQNRSHFTIVFS